MDPLNLILLIIVMLIGWRLRSFSARAMMMKNRAVAPMPIASIATLMKTRPNRRSRANCSRSNGVCMKRQPALRMKAAEDREEDKATNARKGRGLAFFNDIDPHFDEAGFLDGAARAYEMILTAFANDDLTDVRGFLGDDVAAGFEAAIAARQAAGQKLETRILRLDRPALDDAEVDGDKVRLDVRLRAEIISASYAATSALDEDNLPPPTTSVDIWSFEGAHNSANPNWQLVATRAD